MLTMEGGARRVSARRLSKLSDAQAFPARGSWTSSRRRQPQILRGNGDPGRSPGGGWLRKPYVIGRKRKKRQSGRRRATGPWLRDRVGDPTARAAHSHPGPVRVFQTPWSATAATLAKRGQNRRRVRPDQKAVVHTAIHPYLSTYASIAGLHARAQNQERRRQHSSPRPNRSAGQDPHEHADAGSTLLVGSPGLR